MFSEDPQQDKATHWWAMVVTGAIALWFLYSFFSASIGATPAHAIGQASGLILGLGATACFGLPLFVYRFKFLRMASFAVLGIATLFASAKLSGALAPYMLQLHPEGADLVICGAAPGAGRYKFTAPDVLVARSDDLCDALQDHMLAGLSGDAAVAAVNSARP